MDSQAGGAALACPVEAKEAPSNTMAATAMMPWCRGVRRPGTSAAHARAARASKAEVPNVEAAMAAHAAALKKPAGGRSRASTPQRPALNKTIVAPRDALQRSVRRNWRRDEVKA